MVPDGGFYNSRLMWFPTREALEVERTAWHGRLAAPCLRDLEAHFGASCPPELAWLYDTHDFSRTDGFVDATGAVPGMAIQVCVWPADLVTLEECWAKLPAGHFPFAEAVGSFYTVRFDAPPAERAGVYYIELGSPEALLVTESLREFISGRM